MGRKEQRIKNKLEKNPIKECLSIQKKFYPRLFNKFNEVADPRNSSYIDYSNRVMLGTLYFKSICSVPSMQSMTNYFNKEEVVSNIYNILGDKEKEYQPHYVTLNEYLERLNPKELENIQHDIVYRMIRRKTFNDAEYSIKKLSDEEIKQD
ncbi:transposase family protein [Clostridium sp. HCP1S3_A12]|uniref:transposase family protein n=1 Tax=Clostridium sp. HCP1S3_A12 TaxID=3438917 RepID=UPI003F8BA974